VVSADGGGCCSEGRAATGTRQQQPKAEEVMFGARGKQVAIAVGIMVSC